jgi:transposase
MKLLADREVATKTVERSEWIWNWAEQHFPGAVQIVDLFHARPLVGFGSQAASP